MFFGSSRHPLRITVTSSVFTANYLSKQVIDKCAIIFFSHYSFFMTTIRQVPTFSRSFLDPYNFSCWDMTADFGCHFDRVPRRCIFAGTVSDFIILSRKCPGFYKLSQFILDWPIWLKYAGVVYYNNTSIRWFTRKMFVRKSWLKIRVSGSLKNSC